MEKFISLIINKITSSLLATYFSPSLDFCKEAVIQTSHFLSRSNSLVVSLLATRASLSLSYYLAALCTRFNYVKNLLVTGDNNYRIPKCFSNVATQTEAYGGVSHTGRCKKLTIIHRNIK